MGANIKTMIAEADDFDTLLQRGMSATAAEFENDSLTMELTLLNKVGTLGRRRQGYVGACQSLLPPF